MRSSVSVKVITVLGIVLAMATIALVVVYNGLSRVGQEMRQLAEVREPSYTATNKIEINLNGMAHAVFAYLRNPEPQYRTKMQDDEADVAAFYDHYLELAATDAERVLAARLDTMFQEFRGLGRSMVERRERQEAALTEVAGTIERADASIDRLLHLTPSGPGSGAKLAGLSDLESELAEIAFGMSNYQRAHDLRFRRSIEVNSGEVRATLNRLTALPLSRSDAARIEAVGQMLDRTLAGVRQVLDLEDELRVETARFLELSTAMDDLLDEEIQPLALEQLYQPRRAAGEAMATVLWNARWLIPAVLLVVSLVGIILIRSVLDPLRRLKAGTQAVGRGDLTHHIEIPNQDEFGDVAAEFNRMVERLRTTTVSKQALERSDRRLRRTVRRLRREIVDRIQAVVERARMERSLRQAETMSAMGTLVAGVAHEVRNPLFGIQSVVDAMEARFAEQRELQRYFPVLREEVARLTRLMGELMEYGKPANPALTPGPIEDVLTQALRHNQSLAATAGVRLAYHPSDPLPPVRLEPSRLLRIFQNLLENAIQHSEPDGVVQVKTRVVGDNGTRWIECSVSDSGPGFAPADLPRVFEPFYTRRRGGTGLGLSIGYRIAQEHGGEIVAANRPEGGAILTVRLPASSADRAQKEAHVAS